MDIYLIKYTYINTMSDSDSDLADEDIMRILGLSSNRSIGSGVSGSRSGSSRIYGGSGGADSDDSDGSASNNKRKKRDNRSNIDKHNSSNSGSNSSKSSSNSKGSSNNERSGNSIDFMGSVKSKKSKLIKTSKENHRSNKSNRRDRSTRSDIIRKVRAKTSKEEESDKDEKVRGRTGKAKESDEDKKVRGRAGKEEESDENQIVQSNEDDNEPENEDNLFDFNNFRIYRKNDRRDTGVLSTTEYNFCADVGTKISLLWGGVWTGYTDHTDFELRTHNLDIIWVQHTHTDAFFRNLYSVIHYNRLLVSDMKLKNRLVQYHGGGDLPNIGDVVSLLREFISKCTIAFNIFCDYELTEYNTYGFAYLVIAARSIRHLSLNNVAASQLERGAFSRAMQLKWEEIDKEEDTDDDE
jgi:hypothetical protein